MKTAFLLIALSCVAYSQPMPSKTLQAILTAQDLRDAKEIAKFLNDKNPVVRAKAAFACGSIQDTSLVSHLTRLLSQKDSDERAAASFALGQMNTVSDSSLRASISLSLTRRLGVERESQVVSRILEALGKIGDERSLNVVAAAGESFRSPYVKAEASLAIGRYAYRGIKSRVATEFVAGLLSPSFRGECWKAAYALMRIADATMFARHEDQIIQAASHPSPDVRMFIASALGSLAPSPKAANALLSMAMSDKDWRVRVNAIKSLAKTGQNFRLRCLPPLLRMIADSDEHVSITAMTALGDMNLGGSSFAAECQKSLVEVIAAPQFSAPQKRASAIAIAKLRADQAYEVLNAQFRRSLLTKGDFAAALAFVPTPDAMLSLSALAKDENTVVARIALESLLDCARSGSRDAEQLDTVKAVFRDGLRSKDFTHVIVAASALADSMFFDDDAIVALTSALRSLRSPNDTETITSIMQAMVGTGNSAFVAPIESCLNDSDPLVVKEAVKSLRALTGDLQKYEVRPEPRPSHTNFDWNLLGWLRDNSVITVVTTKGVFEMRLLVDEAPFTCINFGSLVKQRFFDRKLFHRVVPNFVIQGGDPRGDGWGGPGYTIRSEFGFEHYNRGVVGVASSGKDTEGCQWFVTHCNTPHLDGRYTIFANVISGMDVVDRMQVGDTIEEMKF